MTNKRCTVDQRINGQRTYQRTTDLCPALTTPSKAQRCARNQLQNKTRQPNSYKELISTWFQRGIGSQRLSKTTGSVLPVVSCFWLAGIRTQIVHDYENSAASRVARSPKFRPKSSKGPGKNKVVRKNLWPKFGRIFPKVAEKGSKKFLKKFLI